MQKGTESRAGSVAASRQGAAVRAFRDDGRHPYRPARGETPPPILFPSAETKVKNAQVA